jgi:hypothetical protein
MSVLDLQDLIALAITLMILIPVFFALEKQRHEKKGGKW